MRTQHLTTSDRELASAGSQRPKPGCDSAQPSFKDTLAALEHPDRDDYQRASRSPSWEKEPRASKEQLDQSPKPLAELMVNLDLTRKTSAPKAAFSSTRAPQQPLPAPLSQATSGVHLARSSGGDPATLMTIHSDRLGAIEVFASLRGQSIDAHLGTSDEEVARLLERNRDLLCQRLAQHAGEVQLTISYGDRQADDSPRQSFREHVRPDSERPHRQISAERADVVTLWTR